MGRSIFGDFRFCVARPADVDSGMPAAAIVKELYTGREMGFTAFTLPAVEEIGSEVCTTSVAASAKSYFRCTIQDARTMSSTTKRVKTTVTNRKMPNKASLRLASWTKNDVRIHISKHEERPKATPSVVTVRGDDGDEERQYELRVCTHKTCRKSGSLQTLELLKGLASPNIVVESCGCLGRCGAGPNLVVLPPGIFVSHCNTGVHAARLLAIQCGLSDPDNNLKALALKQQGNKAFEAGDIAQADILFSQAIDLQPSGGLHLLYANRSAARLAKGDADAALKDAMQAARLAPTWHTPLLRQGEAYMSVGNYNAAQAAYSKALLLDPSLRGSKSYQRKIRELEGKLIPVNSLG